MTTGARELLNQITRFGLTGALNTAFSYAIYAACIHAGAGYALASAASMAAGIVFSHKTTGRLVFNAPGGGTLLRFAGCYLAVYGLSVLLLETLDSAGWSPYLSGIVVALPAALLSFVLLKTLVFRSPGTSEHGPVDRRPGL